MSNALAETKENSSGLNLEQEASKWESALESNPEDVDALVQLSLCYGRMRRSAEALEMARRAVELAPESAPAHHALGVELFLLDENEDAERELRRATELDPEWPTAYFLLAQVLADLGERDAAGETLAKARDLAGEDPPLVAQGWYVEAYINLAGEDFDEAERCLSEALELEEADPRVSALAYANLGSVQARRRQYGAAIDSLETALRLNPYLGSANKVLGQLYLFQRRYSDALAALQAASNDPRAVSPVTRYCLGLAHDKLGDAENARRYYQEALESGLTGYYSLAARRALIWGRPVVRWLVYAVGAALVVWLAATRLPTPTLIFVAVLIGLYLLYRWWLGRR